MRTLIHGGLVVDTEPVAGPLGVADVLVEDGRIVAVGSGLAADPRAAGAESIDATGLLVLPGLVDTHRHAWQAVLRGTTADATLGEYFGLVFGRYAPHVRPDDAYAGTLAGALECLDAGVTTLCDWSNIQNTPAHADAAVAALRDAGVRAVFGYGPSGADFPAGRPLSADARRVRKEHFPTGDGLVTMALAPVGPAYGDAADTAADWRLASELDVPITVHVSGRDGGRPVQRLQAAGLLGPATLYVHGNHLPAGEFALIADSGGTGSVTPLAEMRLGNGLPPTGPFRAHDIPTGLGVDVVTSGPGDLFTAMRTALAAARTAGEPLTAADVLRMATLDGARALGLGDEIGSLRAGKQADLVLLRTDTPAMAPLRDPVGAIVTGAGIAEVDTVLVAGRVVKRGGRLAGAGRARELVTAAAGHLHAAAG